MTSLHPTLRKISDEIGSLQDQFSRRESDIAFQKSGGQVYYGIDNDVITSITAPWLTSSAAIFGPLFTDWPDSAQAFATIFGEFVQNPRRRDPFFLIPPGHNELEGLWNEVYLSAIGTFDEVDAHFTKLLDHPSDQIPIGSEYNEALVYDAVQKAINIIYGGMSPVTQLRRITRLSESDAIRRLDSFLDASGTSPFFFPGAENPRLCEKTNLWQRRLDKIRKDRLTSNVSDASVLALVEVTNEWYIENMDRRRLCFVTGDSHIYRVASLVQTSSGSNFSREYLRRPTAFLADSDFFTGAGLPSPTLKFKGGTKTTSSGIGVADWLREIFAIHINRTFETKRIYSTQLLEAIRETRLKWGEYLKSNSAALSISQSEIRSAVDFHSKAARYLNKPDVANSFRELRKQVEVVSIEAKLGFTSAGALSRFWSLVPTDGQFISRGLPTVRFDSFREADKLAKTLARKDGLKGTQILLSKEWLATLDKEDRSGYTTKVIFALAFASVAEWGTALNVAKLAYSIARTRRELKATTTVKGDESAYLCAVFTRLTAQSLGDLSACSDWLDEAERLRRLPPLRIDIPTSGPDADERFVSERLALRLTRALFERFSSVPGDSSMSRALIEGFDSFDILLAEHFQLLSDLRPNFENLKGNYVYDQVFVNSIQCLILSSDDNERHEEISSSLRVHLERFLGIKIRDIVLDELEECVDKANSRFIQFVLYSALLTVFLEEVDAALHTALLSRLTALAGVQKLMPYDAARASYFVNLARDRISKFEATKPQPN